MNQHQRGGKGRFGIAGVVIRQRDFSHLEKTDRFTGAPGFFKKMLQLYPTAFVYCFFHPKIGIWLGATPEQLIKADDIEIKTMALAGTQKKYDSDTIIWYDKEKQEQLIVDLVDLHIFFAKQFWNI